MGDVHQTCYRLDFERFRSTASGFQTPISRHTFPSNQQHRKSETFPDPGGLAENHNDAGEGQGKVDRRCEPTVAAWENSPQTPTSRAPSQARHGFMTRLATEAAPSEVEKVGMLVLRDAVQNGFAPGLGLVTGIWVKALLWAIRNGRSPLVESTMRLKR